MESLIIFFYIIAFSFFVIIGTYNWFYGKQVERATYWLGLSIPTILKQFLTINSTFPFLLAIAIAILAALTLLSR